VLPPLSHWARKKAAKARTAAVARMAAVVKMAAAPNKDGCGSKKEKKEKKE
jgi:hypothetical protein